MIRGLFASARGMDVELKKQEVISNNLANSNTTGFKKDVVLVRSFSDELLTIMNKGTSLSLGALSESPLIQSIETAFSPGTLNDTGRSLDLAITGDAFFTLQTPQGIRYTKDGTFCLDRDGFLVSSDGYRVLDIDGVPLQILTDNVAVDEDGGIWRMDDQQSQFVGRISLSVFLPDDIRSLEKRGQNLFEAVDSTPVSQGVGQVRQGVLEMANLEIIQEMVNMLSVTRIYEANQKSLQAHDEILGKSVNEVGRLR
ncbi:MAG: flagellar hook-basal body protein [Firmicutes bacterium]|nr:flagellar hook-basal body protein [Bacillota bacterium]